MDYIIIQNGCEALRGLSLITAYSHIGIVSTPSPCGAWHGIAQMGFPVFTSFFKWDYSQKTHKTT